MIRLGILGSTRGTSMQAIVEAIDRKELPAVIGVVVSNKPDALILERAKSNGVPAVYINPHSLTREQYDEKVSALLHQHHVDLVVLIGYMRIISDEFIAGWENKIINVHPSLLPAFAGMMDLDVHKAVIASGVKETGCTVHFVTREVDAGPVILQKKCSVLDDDLPEVLKARVQELEGASLIESIEIVASHFQQ